MATKNKKSTTLDDLATMMNGGFTATQTHMDEQLDALKGELMGLMQDMHEELTATHADVRYVRTTVITLVKATPRTRPRLHRSGSAWNGSSAKSA
jgi:hypothetical protein